MVEAGISVIDLDVSPGWEIHFGVGVGPTAATGYRIVKAIVGRRFSWGRQHQGQ
jgi:hypothetical protein